MIRKAEASDINECVRVIREGFKTVADELDIPPKTRRDLPLLPSPRNVCCTSLPTKTGTCTSTRTVGT